MKRTTAENIPQGECFQKLGGAYAYMRISEASAKFLGLDPAKVYGVCFNGNVASVNIDTTVLHVPVAAMDENRKCEAEWHDAVGADYAGADPARD